MAPADLIPDVLGLTLRVHALERRMRSCPVCSAPSSSHSKAGLCRSCSARRNATAKAMTPFERQMEAVRNGAGIVEVRPIPSRQYAYTLGGVSGL